MAKDTEYMNDNRIIFLSGEITEEKSKEIITKIMNLEAKDPTKDIMLLIDSYGGMVHSMLAVHDVMKHLTRCDIITVGIGKQMSAGQLLLISGTKGKRFATPNSRILMHQLFAGTFGKLADMEVDVEEYKMLEDLLDKLIVKYTKVKKSQLKELLQVDSYVSAQKALELGLIDHIIKQPTDLYKQPGINL